MSEEPEPITSNKPNYYVPAAQPADTVQPNHWTQWIVINCFGFGLSCILFPSLVAGSIFIFGTLKDSGSAGQAPISDGLIFIMVVGIPTFITIYLVTLLQWATMEEGIKRSTWVNYSTIVGTLALLAWLHDQLPIKFPALDNYISFMFQGFVLASSIISWIQWIELRKKVEHAWQWVVVSIAIWTGIGTFVLGIGIGSIVSRYF
ncbi:hypothetical protein ACP8Y2_14150 [Herpetosiphon llansteffanensis]